MDHFPLPQGATHIAIPYVGVDYDLGQFASFPTRHGWSEEDLRGTNNFGNRPPGEVESFFQTWLFFGTLIKTLDVVQIPILQSDYIRVDESGKKFLATSRLPELLERWACKQVDITEGSRKERKKARRDMERRSKAVKEIVRKSLFYTKQHCTGTSPLSPETRLSIIALGSTVYAAASWIYWWPSFDARMLYPPPQGVYINPYLEQEEAAEFKWPASELLTRRLRESEWCVRDIAQFHVETPIDCHYYFASTTSPRKDQDHSKCTKDVCFGGVVDLDNYRTKHVNNSCTCRHLEAIGVVEIIMAGKVPLVTWDDNAIKIIERGPDVQYVAISHIWTDGLGHQTQNSLPACQLCRIQGFVNDLFDEPPERRVPFWIDTLCVPVQEEFKQYRKLAIKGMRDIYQNAESVLVLDAYLQEMMCSTEIVEKATRLYLCNWQRRLWTFQEGVFARKLFFGFKDGYEGFAEIEEQVYDYVENGPELFSSVATRCYSDVVFPYTILKDVDEQYQWQGAMVVMAAKFPKFAQYIQKRTSTRKSDETICFLSLLGLDPTPLFAVPDEQKMQRFLQLVRQFDQAIVFNKFTRLQIDGFRWAPVSFMGQSTEMFDTAPLQLLSDNGGEGSDRLSILGPEGLLITSPGFRIPSVGKGLPSTIQIVAEDCKAKISVPEDEKCWRPWESSEYAIILKSAEKNELTEGILGSVQSQKRKTIKFRHICRLTVQMDSSEVNIAEVKGHWLKNRNWCIV